MIFLVNKPRTLASKKKATMRKKTASKPSAKQLKARKAFARMVKEQAAARRASPSSKTRRTGDKMAAKKKARRTASKKKVVRRRRSAARKPATLQLKRRGRVVYANGRKRPVRRRVRRNSPFTRSGVVGSLMSGAKDAAAVLVGMAGTNFISSKIPFGDGNRGIETAKKLAVTLGLGMVAQKAVSRAVAEKVVIGGIVAIAMDFLKDVPVVGGALSGDYGLGLYYDGASNAALSAGGSMGAWAGTGDGRVVDSARLYRS
jgi:hypothetical protein